jgi:hypothetical protein
MITLFRRGLATAGVFALALSSCSSGHPSRAATEGQVEPQEQGAPPASFTDPDDVNLPLDLKTLTHQNTATTVTYTVETYEPFKDNQADFAWAIDKNNDGVIDNYVSVEFESNKIDGKFEDTKEKDLGSATVTRTGPNGLKVTFAKKLIGAAAYQYRVTALSDLNGNDEEDPGETDLAPDTGFYQHRL